VALCGEARREAFGHILHEYMEADDSAPPREAYFFVEFRTWGGKGEADRLDQGALDEAHN